MAGFTYEISVLGTLAGTPIANIYHVFDGDENESPNDVADVFETDHLPDCVGVQSNQLTWSRINVVPLDVGNLQNAVSRIVSIVGIQAGDFLSTGTHAWIKFVSDDNGFKSGGKLFAGLMETNLVNGVFSSGILDSLQAIFDAYLADLTVASLSACILRPVLSTPGFPSISIVSAIGARGLGTNNRRQAPFSR